MAKELITGRMVLPVLDGVDEMDVGPGDDTSAPIRSAPHATAFLAALKGYADLNQPAPVVMTCREDAYARLRAAGATVGTYREITIRDLDAARIGSYLHTRYPDPAHPQRRDWDQVLRWLDQPEGAAALRVLSTPWRLLLAISAVEDGQRPVQLLAAAQDESPNAAVERIDRDLLAAYVPAATRLTVRRGRSGIRVRHYNSVKAAQWMRSLAWHLQWQDREVTQVSRPPLGMSAIDLVPHLLWPIGGPRLVRVFHAALAFLLITAAMVGALYLQYGRPAGGRNVLDSLSEPSSIGVVLLALLVTAYSAKAWHAASSSARGRQPLSRRLARGIKIGFECGFVAWIMFWFAGAVPAASPGPSPAASAAAVPAALAAGIGFGILAQFGGESWSPEAELTAPYNGLRRERWSAMLGGLVAGLTAGSVADLAPAPLGGLRTGLAYGLVVGTGAGLMSGALWIRCAIGISCAQIQGRLPFPLESFMKWACDSGLLRIAGTTYQFRHRQLQGWLSQNNGDPT